jgi:uncharacterized repeat protein (TIGR01451 family)
MPRLSSARQYMRTTHAKINLKYKCQPVSFRAKAFGRLLRLEYLEERALLSVGAGNENNLPALAANVGNYQANSVAAATTADASNAVVMQSESATASTSENFYGDFQSDVAIPETPTIWVGYDIDASSIQAGSVITKIIIHHAVLHQRISDLQVKLYNDSGAEWLIRENSGGWVENFDEYRTDTTVFAGKEASQTLHYRICDTVANGMTGILDSLEMWIYYQYPPDMTIAGSHVGNFVQGQIGAAYIIRVTNSGNGPTFGPVSVHDILPAGVTATAISGAGWTCDLGTLTATRSDELAPGADYAPITVTVNVASDAPSNIVNAVQVSGGGEVNAGNNNASDSTNIVPQLAGSRIVGANLSAAGARDGQTITVGYQISSDVVIALQLNCTLVGPGGEVVADAIHADIVNVTPGTAWYMRSFVVDLPPKALSGVYDVTWTIHSDQMGDDAFTQAGALTIDPPISLTVPALMYHNISDIVDDFYTVSTTEFAAQMRALKAYGYTAVTLQDVLDYRAGIKTPPAKPVLITMDDAYESWLTLVLPIISDPSINYKMTGFVNTGIVRPESDPGGWYSDPLSWSEIQTLHDSGMVDIESHTVNHLDLTMLTPIALMSELLDSKNQIESHLGPGKRVNFIAYPYGYYNDAVEQAAWEAGYAAAMNVYDELELTCDDKYALDRLQMDWHTSVNYDAAYPDNFLFNKLQDPDVGAPNISIAGIQYLDPATMSPLDVSQMHSGQSVLIRVNANNSGPATTVCASLALDSDNNHTNGVDFDSHPGQDIQVVFPNGTKYFDWTWTVPDTEGLYYSQVAFHDVKYVLGFKSSVWQTAFQVVPPEVQGTPGNDVIRLIRNLTNPNIVDVFVNNPGPNPSYSLNLSTITQLHVFSGDGDDQLTLDFSNGDFVSAGGLFYVGGGHLIGDSLIINGGSGNENIILTDSQLVLAGMQPVNYTDNEFFGFDLGSGNNTLRIDHATVLIKNDNAISAGTNVIVDGGVWDLNGKSDSIGGLTLLSGSVVNGSLHASSYQIESGTVTAAMNGPGNLIKSTAGQATAGTVATANAAVNAGHLVADSIVTGTLTIGAGAKITISPIPGSNAGVAGTASTHTSSAAILPGTISINKVVNHIGETAIIQSQRVVVNEGVAVEKQPSIVIEPTVAVPSILFPGIALDELQPRQHTREALGFAAVHDAILIQFGAQKPKGVAQTALTSKLFDFQTVKNNFRTEPTKKVGSAALRDAVLSESIFLPLEMRLP